MNSIIKTGECWAIIPARGGSKGVPGKNIKKLGGHPLIAYSIAAGLLSKSISRVIITTDTDVIKNTGILYGAEVPFLRPAEISQDTSTDDEFMIHAINWFAEHEKQLPEYWVHLRPTTPLRVPSIIDEAVQRLQSEPEAHCLRSAHQAPESPFKWFLLNEKGYFASLKNGMSMTEVNQPRQGFPDVYIPDGYVDVLKTAYIVQTGKIHSERMIGFISPFCLEVDVPEDFRQLEYELTTYSNPLKIYLDTTFGEQHGRS